MKEPPRQKWTARLILFLLAAAAVAWLASLNLGRKVSTDVLDLIPTDERSPELSMVRTLAGQEEARVILLALRVAPRAGESPADNAQRSEGAAAAFARTLGGDPAIAEATPLSDAGPRDGLAAMIFARRLDLLL
ncbi:MAG TPA: hypothetical protein VIJ19_01960, partial [Opitutaceae bacterium]